MTFINAGERFKVFSIIYQDYLGETDDGVIIWVRGINRARVFTKPEFDQAVEDYPWLKEGKFLFLGA